VVAETFKILNFPVFLIKLLGGRIESELVVLNVAFSVFKTSLEASSFTLSPRVFKNGKLEYAVSSGSHLRRPIR
jgi:hypothetical protein